MGRYIGWDDIVLKYPSAGTRGGATEVGSTYIGYVEAQVDGLFSGFFTTPFSSNNITVKDICIDLTYARIGNFKIKEREEFQKSIIGRIENIKMGGEAMVTTSGDSFFSTGDSVYSSTEDYHPVFGMGSVENFVVDSSQLYDEENARG